MAIIPEAESEVDLEISEIDEEYMYVVSESDTGARQSSDSSDGGVLLQDVAEAKIKCTTGNGQYQINQLFEN